LIYYPHADKTLLFDLKKDPLEINDIAAKDASSSILKDLRRDLIQLQIEVGDTLKLPF